jgi:flagellin
VKYLALRFEPESWEEIMAVINTNVSSLVAQNAMVKNERAMTGAMEQLSTGKRINSAADDAAGLAISSRMTSQIRGLNQAVRNANDAISMVQTADGALGEVTNMLQRMRELTVQGSSGTYGADEIGYLADEFEGLRDEIFRIVQATQFNGTNLLDGDVGGAVNDGTVTFQIGPNASQTVDVDFGDFETAVDMGANFTAALTISTNADSTTAMGYIDTALDSVNAQRAVFGAAMNRLEYAADNLANESANTQSARSRILDADYASATTELARTQIIQQAGTAMLAQANQMPQSVLSLLQ